MPALYDGDVDAYSRDRFYADSRAEILHTRAESSRESVWRGKRGRRAEIEPSCNRVRRTDDSTIWADNGVQLCGARKRDGNQCRRPALGNGRCTSHGGLRFPSPPLENLWKGNANMASVYAAWYSDDEVDIYDSLRVGTLEEELKLLRLQLRRALRKQAEWEVAKEDADEALDKDDDTAMPEALRPLSTHYDIDEVAQETSDGTSTVDQRKRKVVRRKRDYRREIQFLLQLIAQMEATHANIVRDRALEGETLAKIAADLRAYESAAKETTPGLEDLARRASAPDVEMDETSPARDPA